MKILLILVLLSVNSFGFFNRPRVRSYSNTSFEYDYEGEKIICMGSPRYDLSSIRDREERQRWRDEERQVRKIDFNHCESSYSTRNYWTTRRREFTNSESQRVCSKHIRVNRQWIAIDQVDDSDCLYASDAPETSLERLHLDAGKRVIDGLCSDIEKCTLIIDQTNRNILFEIGAIIETIDRQNDVQKIYEQFERDGNDDYRREMESIVDSYKRALSLCQTNLPTADESLANDLRLDARTLERDISVFHWFPGDKALMSDRGYYEPENTRSLIYARVMQGLFWDRTNTRDVVGQGLYAASDPSATSSYGDKVLRIDLEEGTEYLDIRSNGRGFQVSPETQELLREEGCDFRPTGVARNGNYIYHKASLYEDRTCRRIFNRVIESEGYGFLAYDYRSDLPSFCDRSKGIETAFVLFNVPLNSDSVDMYTNSRPEDIKDLDEDELRRLQEFSVLRRSFDHGTQDFSSEQRREVEQQWKDRLFDCSSEYND